MPLSVALVWHMHQPYYRDDVAKRFMLPWVRRRAAKDYLHMLEILARHPTVRVTMNMVPSLLLQLEAYSADDVVDVERDLCLRPATSLSPAERHFLLDSARQNDYGGRVEMLRPYLRLMVAATDAASHTTDTVRDLQVWSLLAWMDPAQVARHPRLSQLAAQGGGFTEDDKQVVDQEQRRLLRDVVPAYRRALEEGRVEAMTSPLHHPILPLLIDDAAARVASPNLELPEPPFCRPEDAAEQVRRGLDVFESLCGQRPTTMWPPECAVSPAAVALLGAQGVACAVSDEGILARTLEVDVRGEGLLYRPHRDQSGVVLVFRDAELSNRIGFVYPRMDAEAAVDDLRDHLHGIAARLPDGDGLVTIALDGENVKDYLAENGTPFLDALYTMLAEDPALQTVHLRDHLATHEARELPSPLWSGSWIDASYRTWIGDAAHTRAWSLLGDVRGALDAVGGADAKPDAYCELLIAEGSDWYWWFGDHHDSRNDAAWDALFRVHLRNACTLAGLAVPPGVDEPVIGTTIGGDCAPLRWINPADRGPSEWDCAGVARVGAVLGAMHPSRSSVGTVRYGGGGGRLHLRLGDGAAACRRLDIDAGPAGTLTVTDPVATMSIALPAASAIDFTLSLHEEGRGVERLPPWGRLHLGDRAAATTAPLRVVLVAAECAPLVAAGELADAVADIAAEAAALGHDVVVVVPRHRRWHPGRGAGVRLEEVVAPLPGGERLTGRVIQEAHPVSGIPVLSIDSPGLFDRERIYGETDDLDRYLSFAALAAAVLAATSFSPDIVEGFEWQSASLLAWLSGRRDPPALVLGTAQDSPAPPHDSRDSAVSCRFGLPSAGDLLELGSGAADALDVRPRTLPLSTIYSRALTASARKAQVPRPSASL